MAFPNLSDILTTTIQSRSKKLADNLTKNNAIFDRLSKREGGIRTVSGGDTILEELMHAENGNFGWYAGYEELPMAPQDVITSASFDYKQAAVSVVISGIEQLKNSGKEQMIDLMGGRIRAAEATLRNNLSGGMYSDGSANGGKQVEGLAKAIPLDPTSGIYGGINRLNWPFWRPQLQDRVAGVAATKDTVQLGFNSLWAKCSRGSDRPDLILLDNELWQLWMASLQSMQRITSSETAKLGFPSTKYQDADVVLDGGIGGFCPANTGFFLNTEYISWRPHKDRNMVPLSPSRRVPFNQDAVGEIIAFAGNMTMRGAQFQGRFKNHG